MSGADEPSGASRVTVRHGVRLGVDVGSVRVGLSASDPTGLLASPVETVPRDLAAAGDQRRIHEVALERAAIEVIVGLPRSLSGGEGPAAETVRAYATQLALVLAPVPVRLVDERLTTVDAHRTLRTSGVAGRAHRGVVDQAAAVLILQGALDAERLSGGPPGELVLTRRRRTKTRASRPDDTSGRGPSPDTKDPTR
ncbi:Holliday junction resolvase RuvX [Dermatophilaceae bacterium Soc4.6]